MKINSLITSISNVSIRFGDHTPWVLKDITFNIYERDFITIIGASGCGKTTLLNLISNILPPTTGLIQHFSKTHSPLSNPNIAYVFQQSTLLPWLNVLDNLMLVLKLKNTPKKYAHTTVLDFLNKFQLLKYAAYFPHQLSLGTCMRINLIRALIQQPQLLIMDEPFASIDEITRFHLQEELLQILQDFQSTVLFVTHSLSEAVFLSKKIFLLSQSTRQIQPLLNLPININLESSTCPPNFRNTLLFHETLCHLSSALQKDFSQTNPSNSFACV